MMDTNSFTKFKIFESFPDLVCVLSTRNGGSSKGVFAGQNMGLRTGDDKSAVRENRRRFFNRFDITEHHIAFSDQIHSANALIVDRPGIYPQSDALVAGIENLFLAIQTADCFPVFLFDPGRRVIAAIHAGWRGVQAGIVNAVMELLTLQLKLNPEHCYAAVGPGLQKECFEVRADVSRYFPDEYLSEHAEPGKRYLDLSGHITAVLTRYGIPAGQIENSGQCTMCERETYFSYRRDGGQSGRMIGLIGMRGSGKRQNTL